MQQQSDFSNKRTDYKIIIQARMGSQRFPGKSFYFINGTPSLQYLIQGLLSYFDTENIIIATSINKENDIIRSFCTLNKINCFSGDENNVSSRFYEILKNDECKYFIRINGDSPLFCALELFSQISNRVLTKDFYSTILHKTYPKGVNFEIVKTKVFIDNYINFSKQEHFEHVTNYFYENISFFSCENIAFGKEGYESLNFCFDTKNDLIFLEKMFGGMNRPHFEYTLIEKCELAKKIVLS